MRHYYLLFSSGLLLASCSTCQEPDLLPAPFALAFSADTVASGGPGFRLAEVRSAYLIRYATADFQQPLDTLRQTASAASRTLYISYGQHPPRFEVPIEAEQNTLARSFRLEVPTASRRYDITGIVLETETISADRTCPSYRLVRRDALVNNQRRDGLTTPPELTK